MKLSSVVLLSVNLVAASQVAANAADTASFLQDALSPSSAQSSSTPVRAAAPQRAAHAAPAKKHTSRAYVAMTPQIDGVKMRKFVPGRYLPSEAELQAKRDAEIAQQQSISFVPGNSDVLSGRVSSDGISSAVAPVAAYAMSRPVNQDYMHKMQSVVQKVKQAAKEYSAAHTRSVPGMNPVIPGQVARLPGAPHAVPTIPEPQMQASLPMHVPQPPVARGTMPARVPAPSQYVAASAPVVPLPSLSKWDNNQLDKLIETNMPENVYGNINGDMRANGQGNPGLAGAGPPPYPLSTMPINRGRGIQPIGAQARFGSWHGGNQNLPQSSFQSYVPVHMAGPMSVKINHFGSSHKTGRQALGSHPRAHHVATSHSTAVHHAPKAEKPKPAAPVAASYAPYRRYSSVF